MGSPPAERAREGVSVSVFIDIELSILYFLLCFIVAYSIVFFLASPEMGEAKCRPVLERHLSATQGALSSKSVQVLAGRGSLLQTHGKIVPV